MPVSTTTWAKGQSGNPGGRPRILEAVRDIARESTALAIETLRTIAADTDAPHADRVSAATALLDRGLGQADAGRRDDDGGRAEECAGDERRGADGDD